MAITHRLEALALGYRRFVVGTRGLDQVLLITRLYIILKDAKVTNLCLSIMCFLFVTGRIL